MRTFVMLAVLVGPAAAGAQTIDFDGPADGTSVNATYAPLGVSLTNPLGGNAYARSLSSAPSPPNVVSLSASGFPAFDARSGAVDAAFTTGVGSVSVDVFPVAPLEGLGVQNRRPFIEAYDVNNALIGQIYYSGPQPTIPGGYGPRETLSITASSNAIRKARFSSQFSTSNVPTYGVFDNLAFAALAQANLHESFDTETSSGGNYDSFANWKVTRGTVDVLNDGDLGLRCFGNAGKCVDLDGSSNSAGRLETRAAYQLAPGVYVLSFALSGSQRGTNNKSFTVALASSTQTYFSETFTRAPSAPWEVVTRSIAVPSSGAAKLILDSAGGFVATDAVGLIVDQVSFAPASVPVPALGDHGALASLLFAGLGALGFWRRR